MKIFSNKQASLILSLIAILSTGCHDEGVDDLSEEEAIYVLYEGTKDSDGKLHNFIAHKGEIYDMGEKSSSIVSALVRDGFYVENSVKYYFPNYQRHYFVDDLKVNLEIPSGTPSDIRNYEVRNGNAYMCGWVSGEGSQYWVNGLRHGFTNVSNLLLLDLSTTGSDIYTLSLDSGFNFYIHKNDVLSNSFAPGERVADITYASGLLFACGISNNKGAIWTENGLWATDINPGSSYSVFERIKVTDEDVFTSGYITDSNGRKIYYLFKNGAVMTQMVEGDVITDFEIGSDAAYIFIVNEADPKDYFIKVGLSGGVKTNVYLPNANTIGYHDMMPFAGSINHIR